MKTIQVTDFRKNTASFINEIEHGETIVLIRHSY
jgi:antitoxin (DNA-binding transcriptional repressor) of toxin-antitoxin stability system